jgi:hypothetical protein
MQTIAILQATMCDRMIAATKLTTTEKSVPEGVVS